MRRRITCITKRGGHFNPHERIQAVGGVGWTHGQQEAIRNIDARTESYYVLVGGHDVAVQVATHQGRRYLKTENDGYSPDNLLALPECQ